VHAHIIKIPKDIKIRPEDRFTVEKNYEGKSICYVTRKQEGHGVLTNERLSLLVVPRLLHAIKDFQQGRLLLGETPRFHTT